MKKWILRMMLLSLVFVVPMQAQADVNIRISIPLPPPLIFPAPPAVIVLPETDSVYAVPEIDVDLFFWGGWWWRPWEGRWYRSQFYDRGWAHYSGVPAFYFDVDPGWRRYYRVRQWYGYRWDWQPISHTLLLHSWKRWHSDRYWEKHNTWQVRNYHPRPMPQREDLRRERREQYSKTYQGYGQPRPQVRGPQPRVNSGDKSQISNRPQIQDRQGISSRPQTPQARGPRMQPQQNPAAKRHAPDVKRTQRPPAKAIGAPQRRAEHPQGKLEARSGRTQEDLRKRF